MTNILCYKKQARNCLVAIHKLRCLVTLKLTSEVTEITKQQQMFRTKISFKMPGIQKLNF